MSHMSPSSFEEFEGAAAFGNVVPVVRTVAGYFQTPVDVFKQLSASAPYSFLFESVEGGESLARHSFIGIEPEMIVRGRGNQTVIERAGAREVLQSSAHQFISEYFRRKILTRIDGLPPLAGGAVGYLGFQATQWFETAFASKEDSTSDDAVWMFFKTVVAIERGSKTTQIVSVVFTEEAEGDRALLERLYQQAIETTARYEKALLNPIAKKKQRSMRSEPPVKRRLSLTLNATPLKMQSEEVKEHIFAGRLLSGCYFAMFQKKNERGCAGNLSRSAPTNPSPYMFFLSLGEEAVLGASPEMLVRCRGRQLDYRPIAGTRARGATELDDKRLGEEMRADEKEVAEHVMLVDLGRNDLGRVAEYGSVQVEELMTIERYSHVQHLVSSLSAQLRDGLDRL